MTNCRSLNHPQWACQYHVVFIPKYRKKAIYGALGRYLGEVLRRLAWHRESEVEEGHLMADHVHMMLSIPPKHSVAQVVGYITGKSAIHIAREFSGRPRNFVDRSFDLDHPDLQPLDGIEPWWGIFEYVKNDQGNWAYQLTTDPAAMQDPPHHGTFCAGMAAARIDNRHGGAGAAPDADLLLIAVPSRPGHEKLAHAIFYASRPSAHPDAPDLAAPADVISCSINPTGRVEPLLEDALTFAVTEGRCGLGVPIFWSVNNTRQLIRARFGHRDTRREC